MEIVQQFILESTIFKLINVAIFFLAAWTFDRLSWRIAGLILRVTGASLLSHRPQAVDAATGLLKKNGRRHRPGLIWQLDHLVEETMSKKWSELNKWLPAEFKTPAQLRQERQRTLQELVASTISVLAFGTAAIASLYQFANPNTLVWILGLSSTMLAFAGRTFIGDFLAGLTIIFQDRFNVGEKLLVKAQLEKVEGVVEYVSLNATWLRASTGEFYIIPNGEMRFICNYSRGLHSPANVKIKIAAADLNRAVPLLKNLGREAVNLLPGLKEPWQVISEMGVMGKTAELTLVTRAYFGHAAELRPQLLALIQEHLTRANITLNG